MIRYISLTIIFFLTAILFQPTPPNSLDPTPNYQIKPTTSAISTHQATPNEQIPSTRSGTSTHQLTPNCQIKPTTSAISTHQATPNEQIPTTRSGTSTHQLTPNYQIAATVQGMANLQPAVGEEFFEDEPEYVYLPVIMYHGILKTRTSRYIVSPAQLEDDLCAIKKEGFTTVFPSEVLAYANGEGTLPKKPILITFDDGHYNNYHYGLPLFVKYGAKAVINVIGAFSDFTTTSGDISNPNYSHLTWSQIAELASSGHFEIGNHSYNMHKFKPRFGIAPISGEPAEEYEKQLKADIQKMQDCLKQNSGIETNIFAYPFGKYSKSSEKILLDMGFEIIFTCTSGINQIKQNDKSPLKTLKRYNREGNWTTKTLITKITPQK